MSVESPSARIEEAPHRHGTRVAAKLALVIGGLVAAAGVASVVVAIRVAATSGPEWQASSGMLAFGDAALFLGVFTLAAVPAVVAALVWLRPYPRFWEALSVASVLVVGSGVVADLTYAIPGAFGAHSFVAEVAPLRILAAPLFAIGFALAALVSPARSVRRRFAGCLLIETATFAYVVAGWLAAG